MDSPPTFSVIVPTYNRPAPLADCLGYLSRLDYPADRFEVIVVDDGGAADLLAVVERYRSQIHLRFVRQPNTGPGAARNTGANAARHEFLAFTDDDCRPRRDWLLRMSEAMRAHPAALVGGLCINAFPDNLYSVASQMILDVVNDHFNRDRQNAVFFPSDNMAVARDRFLEIGGFDAAFRCAEDRDLCDRWAARGWRLVHEPAAVIDHARQMGLMGYCKQHFGYGKGAWRFHEARKQRHSGTFMLDGNFYLKCFRRPVETQPVTRMVPLMALLGIWQLVNTAGFVYERTQQRRAMALSRRNAAADRGGVPKSSADS